MLLLWIATFIAELALYLTLWRVRRLLAAVISLFIIISVSGICLRLDALPAIAIVYLSAYRLFNMARIIKGRMHPAYLRRATARTSLILFITHGVVLSLLLIAVVVPRYAFSTIAISQLMVAVGILFVTVRNIGKLTFKMPSTFLTDRELPTVTVAIPARNETVDLEACLQSVLANDYPKLEVIVLDDCSQDRTADIIRGFAHDGVRFVKGGEPAHGWLAKNQAYQKLYQEATGDLILFCGVDTRFGPRAIRSMVNLMASKNKSMLSVLPVRIAFSAASAFIQPMRYWWELAFPRRLFNRPPVLSTCWMIGRQDLKRLGGFASVSHAVLPERFLARELVKLDQYSFVRTSGELQLHTVKTFREQYATSIRTRYPQLRRRLENTSVLTILSLLFLLGPFAGLLAGFWLRTPLILLSICACLLLITTHVMIVRSTDPANSLLAGLTFPIAVVIQLWLDYSSMVQYEFGQVEWKDRNICIPVMHIVPHLPKLEEVNSKYQ